jgi:hypothetical protein
VPRRFRCSVAVPTRSTCDLIAVLMNLGPCTRRGGSSACPGVVLRVVELVLMLGRRPCTGSRVRLTGDLELYISQRGGVPSARAPTVLSHLVLKKQTKCIPICMPGSSFIHIVDKSE